MAGTLKVRDTNGTQRTLTTVKVRDVDGTLRTLAFIRVRDADGIQREVFTTGGGGDVNPTSIEPSSRYLSSRGYTRSASFTASATGTAPSSFAWGLLDGNGTVAAGADAVTATLSVYADPGGFTSSTFFCDMVVGTTTYRATCQFDFQNTQTGNNLEPSQ